MFGHFAGAGRALGRLVCLAVGILAAGSFDASAQTAERITGFVVDVRGAIPLYPTEDAVAAPRSTEGGLLPSFGLGVEVGAHVYPLRGRVVALGVGASFHVSRGGRTPSVPNGSSAPAGPTVQARLTAFSPQLSINFGHRMGWSYLSGGIGQATFRAWRDDLPEEDGASTKTINYGGGARWFLNERVAFAVDLRFYAMNPIETSATALGHPRMTRAVVSAGLSLR
jgi:hypothetical protein